MAATPFDATDPRRDITLNPDDRSVRKYVTDNKLDQSGVGSVNNVRILRYADVLLLKAEAVLQSGGSTADAIGLINQVRTRARNMPSVPPHMIMSYSGVCAKEELTRFANSGGLLLLLCSTYNVNLVGCLRTCDQPK